MPEVVIILNCKEDISVSRRYADTLEDMKVDVEQRLKDREEAKIKKRDADREEKRKELEEGDFEDMTEDQKQAKIKEDMDAWEEERLAQEAEESENDDEKPNLEKDVEKQAEKIKEQHAKDTEFLEGLKEALTAKFIPVIEIDTSTISAEFVNIKLLDRLKAHFNYRKDLIEREQVITLDPKEVPVYEASYTFKQSKYGVMSPITPYNPKKTKDFATLYRERIYFFSNEGERKKFMLQPSQYVMGKESFPIDVQFRPRLSVIGLPATGKSELC